MFKLTVRRAVLVAIIAFTLNRGVGDALGQGVISQSSGPVHAAMGGASTAAPLDALGANYWNPAAISGLSQSEVSLGNQLLFPDFRVTSQFLGAGSTTRSDSGVPMIPGFAFAIKSERQPRVTMGLASYAMGAGVNFPGDAANPVFAPTGPLGNLVLGPSMGNVTVFQSVANISVQVTDKLAVGAGPVVDYCMVSFDPAFFAPADDANGDGVSTFPAATHTRPYWGGGFKLGAFYNLSSNIAIGFGYTSPQWLETWIFNSRDELGNARTVALKATLPPIYSWGIAYKGIERLLLTTDLRYIDYKNSLLFGQRVVDGGIGWQSVFAVAAGAQFMMTDRLALRAGYQYNTQPIPDPATLFNIQGPAIFQHVIGVGMSFKVSDSISSSLAYGYALPNSITGTLVQLPGTGTTIQASAHSLTLGFTVRFGQKSTTDAPAQVTSSDSMVATPANEVTSVKSQFAPLNVH